MADIFVTNHGSICILNGATPDGQEWLDRSLDDGFCTLRWGPGGFVVEPRYVDRIVDGARTDGLEVA